MPARPIPEGYERPSRCSPSTTGREWLSRIRGRPVPGSGCRVNSRHEVALAELEIGGRIVMLADRLPIYPWRPPTKLGGTSVGVGMYVEDVDHYRPHLPQPHTTLGGSM